MYKVLFGGQYRDPSGYGKAARNYLKALDLFIKNNPDTIQLKIKTIRFDEQNVVTPEEEKLISSYEFKNKAEEQAFLDGRDFLLIGFHTPHTIFDHAEMLAYTVYAKYIYSMTVWETDAFPNIWKNVCANPKLDGFIAPCEWNRQVFARESKKPVHLIPYVIPDPKISNPEMSPLRKEIFNILSVSQWTYRKGFDILIMAYLMEFHNHKDVLLTIKSYRANSDQSEQEIIKGDIAKYRKNVCIDTNIPSNAKIAFVGNLLSDTELATLYTDCDLFALATRGEGFGLPYSEALMHAKPVLCPIVGGQADFVDPINNYVTDGYWEPCHTLGIFYHAHMNWFVPTIASVRQKLREAYNDWKSGKIQDKGIKAKQYLLDRSYDIVSVGTKFYNTILKVFNDESD